MVSPPVAGVHVTCSPTAVPVPRKMVTRVFNVTAECTLLTCPDSNAVLIGIDTPAAVVSTVHIMPTAQCASVSSTYQWFKRSLERCMAKVDWCVYMHSVMLTSEHWYA